MNFLTARANPMRAFWLLCLSLLLPHGALSAEANVKSALGFLTNEASQQESFLPPDEAFKLEIVAINATTLEAQFFVAPGHYLYRERISFAIKPEQQSGQPSKVRIANTLLPQGEIKNDPNFGEQAVFHTPFAGQITLADVSTETVLITATYQGCSEKGLCYAPIKRNINVNLQTLTQSPANALMVDAQSADDQSTQLLKTGSIWLVVVGFFGAGLLLSLTPCLLPMIPILSSIIVGSKKNLSRRYSFALSVAYVLGMALSYTLAGIAAGLSGNLLSQSLQNAWVLGASSLVFVLLALSMFGFYELKLPQRFEDQLLKTTNRFKGGELIGVFTMGALSALIVSPCVAAPLAGALIYISQTQNVVLGGIALFALSIGMGVPLLLIGASAGQLLPKTGAWMNSVRHFFGVLMMAMAIWLISPVLPLSISFAMWAALFIISAIFLNALDALPQHQTSRHHAFAKFWKGIGIILLVIGVALLIGAASGAKSLLQPLSGVLASQQNISQTAHLNFTRVKNLEDLNSQIELANGKPIMLDFYADWCVACKELEAYTFAEASVQQALKETVLLQADVTANSADDQALLKRFNLFGPPGIVFFDSQGQEIDAIKTIGYQDAKTFLKTLAHRDRLL